MGSEAWSVRVVTSLVLTQLELTVGPGRVRDKIK